MKDYSLIKDRTEEELVLWEYYLIYAVILDVNVKIEDKIIEKYLNNNIKPWKQRTFLFSASKRD